MTINAISIIICQIATGCQANMFDSRQEEACDISASMSQLVWNQQMLRSAGVLVQAVTLTILDVQ